MSVANTHLQTSRTAAQTTLCPSSSRAQTGTSCSRCLEVCSHCLMSSATGLNDRQARRWTLVLCRVADELPSLYLNYGSALPFLVAVPDVLFIGLNKSFHGGRAGSHAVSISMTSTDDPHSSCESLKHRKSTATSSRRLSERLLKHHLRKSLQPSLSCMDT